MKAVELFGKKPYKYLTPLGILLAICAGILIYKYEKKPADQSEASKYIDVLNQVRYEGGQNFGERDGVGIFANDDFNLYEEGEVPTKMVTYAKKNRMGVGKFPNAEDRALKLEKLSSDDMAAGTAIAKPTDDGVTCGFKVYFEDLNAKSVLTFRDPKPVFLNAVQFDLDGVIKDANGKVVGNYAVGQWYEIDVVVNPGQQWYSIYVDGEASSTKVPITISDFNTVGIVRFGMSQGDTPSSVRYIDDWRIYSGDEVRSDEYFQERQVLDQSPYVDQKEMAKLFYGNATFMVDSTYAFIGGECVAMSEGPVRRTEDGVVTVPASYMGDALGLDVRIDDQKVVLAKDGTTYECSRPMHSETEEAYRVPVVECADAFGYTTFVSGNGLVSIEMGGKIDPEVKELTSLIREMERYLTFARPSIQEVVDTLHQSGATSRHPYLLADQDKFEEVRDLTASDPNMAKWFGELKQRGDELKTEKKVEYVLPDGLRLLATSRKVLDKAKTLGLLYRLTGDESYAEDLWINLEAAGNFPDWNPKHYLDVGEMTAAFAIAYDWLYDYWTDDRRHFLEQCIQDKGLVPAMGYYAKGKGEWVTVSNNWNAVCNGGMILGALAIGRVNPELAGGVVSSALWGLESMMGGFAPDGAWHESSEYWKYTMSYFAMAMEAIESTLGTDYGFMRAKGLDNTGESILYATGPQGAFNIHDATSANVSGPEFFWLAGKLGKPELGKARIEGMDAYGFSSEPFDLLWYDPSYEEGDKEDLLFDAYFRNLEAAYFHDGFNDKQAAFAGLHGGGNSVNHGHLDAGQFIYDALGVRWFADLGGDDYNMPEYFGAKRWEYYRLRAEGHNTLVINPGGEADQVVASTSKIVDFQSNDDAAGYAIVDMTPAYAPQGISMKRGLLFRRGDGGMTIRDELTLEEPSEIYWFAHTMADIELGEDKKSAILSEKGVSIYVGLDTDVSGAEFSVTPAEPLPSSPNYEGQGDNGKYSKLTIHANNVVGGHINVDVVPLGAASTPPEGGQLPQRAALAEWGTLIWEGER